MSSKVSGYKEFLNHSRPVHQPQSLENVILKVCNSFKDIRSKRINLTKHVLNVYGEIVNPLLKEVREKSK